MDGKPVDGDVVPPMEFHIHTEIYRRRADVNAVAHTHPVWSTLFSMTGQKVEPVTMQAAVMGPVQTFAKTASINQKALAEELAAALGAHRVVMLKSHGAVVVGADVIEAFVLGIYLEETARRQYLARAIGKPYTLPPPKWSAWRQSAQKPHLVERKGGITTTPAPRSPKRKPGLTPRFSLTLAHDRTEDSTCIPCRPTCYIKERPHWDGAALAGGRRFEWGWIGSRCRGDTSHSVVPLNYVWQSAHPQTAGERRHSPSETTGADGSGGQCDILNSVVRHGRRSSRSWAGLAWMKGAPHDVQRPLFRAVDIR